MLRGLRTIPSLFTRPLACLQPSTPLCRFSQFFDKQDQKELSEHFLQQHRKQYLYYTLANRWKKPLEQKQKRRERKQQLALARAQQTATDPQQAKLVVHNPALGIEYPPQPEKQFAVVQVNDFQYRVMEDSIIMLDTKKDHAINEPIIFENVPLIGTSSYTLLGRPSVRGARVEGIVESISETVKVIVFKKKRRKGYKKSAGARTSLTQCRITRIVYDLTEDVLERAVSLS